MTGDAVKRAPITGVAVTIATCGAFALVGVGIATRPVTANVLTLLHVGSPLFSGLHSSGGFSPMAACVIALVLFLAGVVSGLSGFAFSAVGSERGFGAGHNGTD